VTPAPNAPRAGRSVVPASSTCINTVTKRWISARSPAAARGERVGQIDGNEHAVTFLLDADTRRIDAAGEQSGVLRSWMLSGRDETAASGYLWLEVAKGDSYLNFGCGIRANRATDQVTTWWFITSLRVGLNLHLVEGRVPISRDALRVLIEPGPLFGQEQRAEYRASFAGASSAAPTLSSICICCVPFAIHASAIVLTPSCLSI